MKKQTLSVLVLLVALLLAITVVSVSADEIESVTAESAEAQENVTLQDEPVMTTTEDEVYTINYTLTIKNATNIVAVRIAPGVWTTSSEIKNAEGMISLDSSIIKAGLDGSGNFNYELRDGGTYSVWYKYSDGTQKVASGVGTDITPNVTNDGITVTVNNLYGVKDFFIAKGTLTTYSEVKADYVVNITSAKFAGKKSYTYIVPDEGDYTVWLRYTDTSKAPVALYFNATCIHPEITVDGKLIAVGNLDGIKVIRIAEGSLTTVSEIKNGTNSMSFSAYSIEKRLNDKGQFEIINAVPESGGKTYSYVVQYKNGYSEFHTVTLYKKVPSYTVDGTTITFTNLTGLSLFRYAPGTYTTATAIKEAEGSQYIRPEDVKNGQIKLTLTGKYTFLVQYYEGSATIVTKTLEETEQYVTPGTAKMTINGNSISKYRIVKPASCISKVSDAATKLRDFIKTATGVTLSIVTDSTSASEYEICVGKTNRENGQISRSGMSDLEFTVQTKGNKLFFAGAVDANQRYATFYSVYFFAEKELGFHFYQDDCIVCRPKANITIGSTYKYNFKPGFEARSVYMAGAWEDCFLNDDYYSGANWVHELADWITGSVNAYNAATPCLSDSDNIQRVCNKALTILASHPNANAIWVSMNDSQEYCNCSKCAAIYRTEGTKAGTIIRLCNAVSDAIKSRYPNVVIFTLAYNYAIVPPKVTKPASNVIPYYCMISNCPSHAYNDTTCTMNQDACSNITGWAKISTKLYVWDYACNFHMCMSPLADFYSLRENYNWFYNNKVRGLFVNAVDKKTGDFNELRGYLITQLMYKPTMSETEYFKLMDDFIKDYYGDKDLNLRKYIDIIEALSDVKDFAFTTEPKRMFVYNDVLKREAEIEALWTAAFAEVKGNSTYTERLNVSYLSWLFLKQCARYRSYMVTGTAEKKAQYQQDNQKLWDGIQKYNLTMMENGTVTFNAKTSPESWY